MLSRRSLLTTGALAALAAPVIVADATKPDEPAKPERAPLPPVVAFQPLTAAKMNQIIDRVNELGR